MTDLLLMPFFAGLTLALLLPLIGNLLRLRDEWLATLGLAHLATAGTLLGMAIHLPAFVGALGGAVAGSGVKQFGGANSSSACALMILFGWALTMLIAANTMLGGALSHALVDGQLYFAGVDKLVVGGLTLCAAWVAVRWLAPRLIVARLFPDRTRCGQPAARRDALAFDLLVAVAIAAGASTVGLMASFALVFIPPWLAFHHATSWQHAQAQAVGIGLAGYAIAFALALMLDQPFGPVLVAVLVTMFLAQAPTVRFLVRLRSTLKPNTGG